MILIDGFCAGVSLALVIFAVAERFPWIAVISTAAFCLNLFAGLVRLP